MNNNYKYTENGVVVNHNITKTRKCIDNIEEILIVENNIEDLNKQIELFKQSVGRKKIKRKSFKFACLVLSAIAVLSCCPMLSVNIGWAIGMLVFGIGVSCGFARFLIVDEDIKNSTIEQISNRIMVCGNELDKETSKLKKLKEKSKEVAVSSSEDTKELPTTYKIENLKHKLVIVSVFKKDPDYYIGAYNNGTLANILEECFESKNVMEDIMLIRYLISEYRKQQSGINNIKDKTKSKR